MSRSTRNTPHGRMLLLAAVVATWPTLTHAGPPAATALPTGGQVVGGQGAIKQAGAAMTVTQNTPSMVANWQSFNIGKDASVTFVQPAANSVALNQVLSADPSQIYGKMSANGQVFLVNPNGVYFGPSAKVDTAGLTAAAMKLSNADLQSGNYQFSGGSATVSNLGELAAKEGGFVSLVGGSVDNAGVIRADKGQVAMAAGKEATVNLTPNGLISVKVDTAGEGAKVNNSGMVIADGGRVWMTAKTASPVLSTAVNQSGVVRANTLANKNGEVWIEGSGGEVRLSGSTEARGQGASDSGGRVVATGDTVTVAKDGVVDASGAAGGGTVNLGGGWQGKDKTIAEAKRVTIEKGAKVSADATKNGDGGTVVAWSGEITRMNGAVSAKGAGNGKGGQLETSSRGALGVQGSVDVSAENGKGGNWLLDPNNITITGVTTDVDVDPTNAASPLSYTAGSTVSVYNSSIDEVLTRGASVTLSATGDITIGANISKTGGGASTLTFDAAGNITLSSGVNVASTSGTLSVNFGTSSNNSGTAIISGSVASNGGDVVFHKAAQLISATPVSTKRLTSGDTGASGAITFNKTVELYNQASSTVTLDTQSAKSGATYTGTGGAITFNDQLYSNSVLLPQQLILTTTGAVSGGSNQAGSITFNNSVGTSSNPLGSLTITGPTYTFLNTGSMNFKASSGNVLTFSTISTNYIPKLVLGTNTTTISVTGVSGGSSVDSADYVQSTFDIVTSSALTNPTLTIQSDRSIQVVGSSSQQRKITGDYYNTATNAIAGQKALTVNFRPAQFTGTGGAINSGSIYLDNAQIKSYGADISLGNVSNMAYGVASEQNTDGVRIYQSNIYTSGGNLEIWGRAPVMDNFGTASQVGGLGVYIYGQGTLSTSNSSSDSTGTLTINGGVSTPSSSSAKDAVVIGKNGGATVTLQTDNGAITITGDASSAGTSATAGASYNGIDIESAAMIRSIAGNITLTGTGGGGSASQVGENYGIKIKDTDTQIVSQTGNILLTGLTGGKTTSYGIYASGDDMALGQERDTTTAKAAVSARPFTGNIDLVADTMKFVNTSTSRMRMTGARSGSNLSTGQLNIRPYHDINIQIGGSEASPPSPDSAHLTAPTNPLYLASTLFSGSNAVFTEGFGDITIGRYAVAGTESTKTLTVAGTTSVYDPLNLRMMGTGGNVVINSPLTVQSSSGSSRTLALHVQSGATGTGAISVHNLRLIGSGDVSLTGTNFVDILVAGGPGTADGTSYDGNITLSNAQALTIDQVTSETLGSTATATGIVTANNKNLTLSTSAGDITVKQNIHTGTGTVSLVASAGAVNETGTAVPIITADKLRLYARNTSTLTNINVVNTLAGEITASGQNLNFKNDDSLVIGAVTVGATTVNGLTLNAGNVAMQLVAGDLTQTQAVVTGSSTTGGFYIRTPGSVVLENSANDFGKLAATLTGGSGTLSVVDKNALQLGTAGDASNFISSTGIAASGYTVKLWAGASGTGGVNEVSGALITANQLLVKANDNSTLLNDNLISGSSGAVSAILTGSNKGFYFTENDAILIGSVANTTGATPTASNGIAGGSSTVVLYAKTGDITQQANTLGDIITSSLLLKADNGHVTLQNASNNAGTLAAVLAASSKNFSYRDADALTVASVTPASSVNTSTLAPVSGTAVDGISTANGTIDLYTLAGSLTVSKSITANGAAANTIDLRATGASSDLAINDSATVKSVGGGTIQLAAGRDISTNTNNGTGSEVETSGSLLLQAGRNTGADGQRIELTDVSTLAATSAGNLWLRKLGSSDDLTIGTVTRIVQANTVTDAAGSVDATQAVAVNTLSGLTTTANNGTLTMTTEGGDLTISQHVTAHGSGYVDIRTANAGNLGDIVLNGATISSSSGTVQVIAGNTITTVSGNDGSSNDMATTGHLLLEAGLSIGADGNRIQIGNAARMAARTLSNTGSSGIWVRKLANTSDLEVGTVSQVNATALDNAINGTTSNASSLSGLTTSANNGTITLTSMGGDLSITQNITAHGSGYVDIRTANSGNLGDVAISNGAKIASTSGTLSVIAGNTITTYSANNSTVPTLDTTGNVLLEAGLSVGADGNRIQLANAAVVAARTLSNGTTSGANALWLRKLGDSSDLEVGTVNRVNATALDNAINGTGSNAATLSGLTTSANNGTITLTTQGGDLTVTQNIAANGSGYVDIRTANSGHLGDIAISSAKISSGSGTIQLIAGNTITSNSANSATASIDTSGNVVLEAGLSIGTNSNRLEIDNAAILAARTLSNSGTSGIWLRKLGSGDDLEVGTVSQVNNTVVDNAINGTISNATTLSGLTTSANNGSITLTTQGGDLSITQNITAHGSGYIDIRSANAGNLGDVSISNGAKLASSSGTIAVISGNTISTTSANVSSVPTLETTGNVLLEAGLRIGDDSNRIQLANAAVLAARTLSNVGSSGLWLRKLGTTSNLEVGTVSQVNSTALDNGINGTVSNATSLSGLTSSANNGTITLTTQGGDLSITQNITAHGSGYVDLRTANAGNLGDVAVSNGAKIASSSGTISLIAGNTISTDSANNSSVPTIDTAGNVLLEAGLSMGADGNRIQLANAAILAARTLSNGVSSGANSLWLRKLGSSSDLEVGTVSRVNATVLDNAINGTVSNAASLSGLSSTANNGQITLTTQGGDLTVTQNITAHGSGIVDLRTASAGNGGDVSLNNNAVISSSSGALQLVSGGNITTSSATNTSNELVSTGNLLLTADGYIGSDANRIESSGINTLAVQTPGVIWLRQAASDLIVGTVTAQNSASTLDHTIAASKSGLTTTNNVIGLTVSAGNLTINQAIDGGSADVTLKASGSQALGANVTGAVLTLLAGSGASNDIIQSTGKLSSSQLRFDAGGLVTLSGTPSNVMGTIAGHAGKTLTLSDGGNLVIGSVTSTQGSDAAGTTSGLTSDSGDILLTNSGTLTQTSGAVVTVSTASKGLRIQSTGPVTLSQSNSVANLAANVSGSGAGFTFGNVGDLQLGTVGGVTGITTSNGTIQLTSTTGSISEASGATVQGSALKLVTGGSASLRNNNQVNALAAVTGSDLAYYNTGNLDITTVAGTNGITAGGKVWVRSGADLTTLRSVVGNATGSESVVLSATAAFWNQAGATAVQAPNGRWLIYDDNPLLQDRLGGLTYTFRRVYTWYNDYLPSQVSESGNGYITTAFIHNPEQYARQTGGATSSAATGNTNTNAFSVVNSGMVASTSLVQPAASLSTPLARPSFSLDGATSTATSVLPLVLPVTGGARFVANLSSVVPEGEIAAITQTNGEPVPSWLHLDTSSMRVAGTVPEGAAPVSLRIQVKVPGSSEVKSVDVQVTPGAPASSGSPAAPEGKEKEI